MSQHSIYVDDEVWAELQKRAIPLKDSPNTVLRRVLLPREMNREILTALQNKGPMMAKQLVDHVPYQLKSIYTKLLELRKAELVSSDENGVWKAEVSAPKEGERFIELANRWHDETDHLSAPGRIIETDTYREIISMGEPVIPLILQDLQERGGNWYPALRWLSHEDPVPAEVYGEVPKMKEAWLSWGRDKGYIK